MSVARLIALALFCVFIMPGVVWAEGGSEEDRPQRERIEVDGYLGRPVESHPGSLTAGFLALGPGAFFHGLGHFHVGQEERGLALLATEVTGLGLVILSDVLESSGGESERTQLYQQLLAQSGWSLFFGSWFADVIGGSRGSRPFARIKTPERNRSFELGYSYLNADRRTNEHLAHIRLNAKTKVLAVRVQHDQATESGSWLTRIGTDVRLEKRSIGLLAAGIEGGTSTRYEQDWSFIDVTPYMRWRLDLGILMSSLKNASFIGRFGYGRTGYVFNRTGITTIWQSKDLWSERLVYDTGLRFALGPKLVSEVALVHDTSLWIGPTDFQPIDTFVPRSMLMRVRFKYRYRELNLHLNVLSGDGQQVSLALEYGL
jgi:hypothetical protein